MTPQSNKRVTDQVALPDLWKRPANRYPGCTCPPVRYNPRHPKPTNPNCPTHGDKQ